jgi:hypothetical protein
MTSFFAFVTLLAAVSAVLVAAAALVVARSSLKAVQAARPVEVMLEATRRIQRSDHVELRAVVRAASPEVFVHEIHAIAWDPDDGDEGAPEVLGFAPCLMTGGEVRAFWLSVPYGTEVFRLVAACSARPRAPRQHVWSEWIHTQAVREVTGPYYG